MNNSFQHFYGRNKRFFKAILAAFFSTILCVIVGTIFSKKIIQTDYLFLIYGFVIGTSIRKFSRGIGNKIYILAPIFTVIGIFLTLYFYFFFPNFTISINNIRLVFIYLFSNNIRGIFSIIFYGFSCFIAYYSVKFI